MSDSILPSTNFRSLRPNFFGVGESKAVILNGISGVGEIPIYLGLEPRPNRDEASALLMKYSQRNDQLGMPNNLIA